MELVCLTTLIAGIGAAQTTISKKFEPHDSKIFDFVIQVNLFGVFNLNKHCATYMAQNEPDQFGLRGVIINVASVAAQDGQKGQVSYAASKGAVTGMYRNYNKILMGFMLCFSKAMTLPMARDLGRHGIRVMTVLPGIMETPLMVRYMHASC